MPSASDGSFYPVGAASLSAFVRVALNASYRTPVILEPCSRSCDAEHPTG